MPRSVSIRVGFALAFAISTVSGAALVAPDSHVAAAQAVGPNKSGLPLPRFVSLKANRANLRVGPGRNYAVEWMYLKSGLPVEIIQEFDNWRRIRDSEGTVGWINQSLLSGKRTGIVTPWNRGKEATVALFREPSAEAARVADLEAGVLGSIERCNGDWCQMRFGSVQGWVEQSQIWGAYPNEKVSD